MTALIILEEADARVITTTCLKCKPLQGLHQRKRKNQLSACLPSRGQVRQQCLKLKNPKHINTKIPKGKHELSVADT